MKFFQKLSKLNQKLSKKKVFKILRFVVISGIFGSLLFLFLYGRYPLYFSHVNWIYKSGGDSLQHQLGWEWFRQEPWSFPLGQIKSYGYPFGTYLSYLDSIPLVAIPLKLFSPLLQQRFQYFGVWELFSMIMQFAFGMLIIGEFTPSYPKKILGAILLVLSPPMIHRAFVHSSLSAHWILLCGIWLIIREYKNKSQRFVWPLLFGIAVLVHLYFVAMLIPLWLLSLYFKYRKPINRKKVFLDVLLVFVVVSLLGWCTGIFSLDLNNIQSHEYGYFSWNLNGFLNPSGSSTFLEGLNFGVAGQYEGYSYLGLGNLLIFPIALILFLEKDPGKRNLNFFIPLGVISVLYIIFAASNKAYLNSEQIWNINLSNRIIEFFSIFRASGRFIWPVFYLIVLFGLVCIIRNLNNPSFFLIFAIIIQIIDIQPHYAAKQLNRFIKYNSPLQSEFWEAAKTNENIIIIPADDSAINTYEPIALYARLNKMTLNWGYFARSDNNAFKSYVDETLDNLEKGIIDKETMYIFHTDSAKVFAKTTFSDNLILCEIDDLLIGFSQENPLLDSYIINNIDCSVPSD
jgi:hypothetical protein